MFIPDSSFRSIIFEELKKGDKSISSLHRTLTEEGHKVHRLVLTGYLKAMEEMGVLTSREIPPSRVYVISSNAEKDIYGTVQEICANIEEIPEVKRPAVMLYFFQKMFRRPVFQSELALAGIEGDPEVFAVRIPNEDRLELKKQLAKRGYKIPLKDQAYTLRDVSYDLEYEAIMQHAMLKVFKVSGLCVETKQTKLGL